MMPWLWVLWCQLFIMSQGFDDYDNVVYQDNQSTMILGNNGHHSSGKKTRCWNGTTSGSSYKQFTVTPKINGEIGTMSAESVLA